MRGTSPCNTRVTVLHLDYSEENETYSIHQQKTNNMCLSQSDHDQESEMFIVIMMTEKEFQMSMGWMRRG